MAGNCIQLSIFWHMLTYSGIVTTAELCRISGSNNGGYEAFFIFYVCPVVRSKSTDVSEEHFSSNSGLEE
jgi:hypothetical protein